MHKILFALLLGFSCKLSLGFYVRNQNTGGNCMVINIFHK